MASILGGLVAGAVGKVVKDVADKATGGKVTETVNKVTVSTGKGKDKDKGSGSSGSTSSSSAASGGKSYPNGYTTTTRARRPVCWRSTGKPCTTSSSCTVSSYSEPDILPRIRFAEPIARSTRKDIRAGSAEEPLFSNSSRSAAVRSACS